MQNVMFEKRRWKSIVLAIITVYLPVYAEHAVKVLFNCFKTCGDVRYDFELGGNHRAVVLRAVES